MNLYIKPLLGLILLSFVSCSDTDNSSATPETNSTSEEVLEEMASEYEILEEVTEEETVEEEILEEITDVEIEISHLMKLVNFKGENVPTYGDYQIIEKTTSVYIEEVMEEAKDETYSVLLPGERIGDFDFDTTAFAEIRLSPLNFENDSLLNISYCFRINGYVVVQCVTRRNEYNNSDWIFFFKDGEMVWSTVSKHYDSCENDSATIAGLIASDGQYFLMIEHSINNYSFVEINEGYRIQYLFNSEYNPNNDFRM